MPENQALVQHYKMHLQRFASYYDSLLKGHDMEDIHQLRVTIKKIRANLRMFMAANIAVNEVEQLLDILKPLFKKSGRLRELQVNEIVLERFAVYDVSRLSSMITTRMGKDGIKLEKAVQSFHWVEWETVNRRLLEHLEKAEVEALIRSLHSEIGQLWAKVANLCRRRQDGEWLHEVRIALKAVQELLVLGHYLSLSPEWISKKEGIKLLNQDLGDWHDLLVLHDYATKALNTYEEMQHPSQVGLLRKIDGQRLQKEEELVAELNEIFPHTA